MNAYEPPWKTRKLRTHQYLPDTSVTPDLKGVYPCQMCTLPQANRVHSWESDPDLARQEARRMGEKTAE